MHAVFCIGNIVEIEDRLWQVELTSVNDSDSQLQILTECLRNKIEGSSSRDHLDKLMITMGLFDKSEEIYKTLINSTSCDGNLLRQHTRQCEHDLTSISILSPMNDVNRNLNELDQSFMYSQLLKDILLKIEYNTNAKQKLVGYCLELYQNNETELAVINEFQESCHLHTPI
ncbi:unnamed protein product [Rotaria socialis]